MRQCGIGFNPLSNFWRNHAGLCYNTHATEQQYADINLNLSIQTERK